MKEQLKGAMPFLRYTGALTLAMCSAVEQLCFGVAIKVNRDLRERTLSYWVLVAERVGYDYRPDRKILMHFISTENKRRLNERIDAALEERGRQRWQR